MTVEKVGATESGFTRQLLVDDWQFGLQCVGRLNAVADGRDRRFTDDPFVPSDTLWEQELLGTRVQIQYLTIVGIERLDLGCRPWFFGALEDRERFQKRIG